MPCDAAEFLTDEIRYSPFFLSTWLDLLLVRLRFPLPGIQAWKRATVT
jgi:hypothetical protein